MLTTLQQYNKKNETQWIFNWKRNFQKEFIEVYNKDKTSIADVFLGDTAIEFIDNDINVEEIKTKQRQWHKIFWVINAKKFKENILIKNDGLALLFQWKNSQEQLLLCKYLWFDFGNEEMIRIMKMYPYKEKPLEGWGKLITKEDFIKQIIN